MAEGKNVFPFKDLGIIILTWWELGNNSSKSTGEGNTFHYCKVKELSIGKI
jgi:hypothetical protein